ncbi:MAG: O-antigen ligase family protein [Saccharofermentans sp.]|nr:O-antigen ligase family protein [Saccharofermentans sp.]
MDTKLSYKNLISEKAFYKMVVVLIVGMPVVEFFTEIVSWLNPLIIPSFFQPQILALFGILGTFLTVLYWISAWQQKKSLRFADVFYFMLVFFMVISAMFSLNPGEYSYGSVFYCENPLHFLAYYWLYFAGTLIENTKYRKNIIFSFFAVAILEGIFAFLQTFNIELSYSLYYHAEGAAYGLTQNSNFYGGLSVLFVACISGMYIFSDDIVNSKVKQIILLIIDAFIFYTLLGSRARLAWVGFAGLVMFYTISLIVMYKKNKGREDFAVIIKRSVILFSVLFAVFIITFLFTNYVMEVTERSYWEVVNGNADKMGSDRLYNWRMGLSCVPEHWLTGVGLDNYRYVFLSDPNYQFGMYLQDKAHNEYLQILVTQGVPALINYLALMIYACCGAVKSIIKETSRERMAVIWIFLGMFVAYSVQAFFNSSVTYVAMNFWLIIGLVTPRTVIKSKIILN